MTGISKSETLFFSRSLIRVLDATGLAESRWMLGTPLRVVAVNPTANTPVVASRLRLSTLLISANKKDMSLCPSSNCEDDTFNKF